MYKHCKSNRVIMNTSDLTIYHLHFIRIESDDMKLVLFNLGNVTPALG